MKYIKKYITKRKKYISPENDIEATVIKEEQWAKESIEYLKKIII